MPGHLARACPNPNTGMPGAPRGLGAPRGGFGGGFAPRGGFAGGPRPATCYKVRNFSLVDTCPGFSGGTLRRQHFGLIPWLHQANS